MPPDQPSMLLRKAMQDELVLERLVNDRDVDDDTLGFHAQRLTPFGTVFRYDEILAVTGQDRHRWLAWIRLLRTIVVAMAR